MIQLISRSGWKSNLRLWRQRARVAAAKTFWGFDKKDLIRVLRDAGVQPGDVLMVHCGWHPTSGFRGTVNDFLDALMETVGEEGTLAMMSMAYHGESSLEYLRKGKPFDVRRSVSMVGLPTEIFRRRPGVVRGLHPTHSVAAWGAKAEWLIAGQGKELSPFGGKSPFARLVEAEGKILLYHVPFNTMTFEHFLEHQIQGHLPLPLYNSEPIQTVVIDSNGRELRLKTQVLNEGIHQLRRSQILEAELVMSASLKHLRIGRTSIMLGWTQKMLAAVRNMVQQRRGFHLVAKPRSTGYLN